ncbi:MAG TPA: hypothetical protein VMB50_20785 [Myxococcales bacterium]|nr:hypothetical protein [Myxococcales bacterium]
MQDLTPDEAHVLNQLRQMKKSKAWGELTVTLQAGRPVKVKATNEEKLSN